MPTWAAAWWRTVLTSVRHHFGHVARVSPDALDAVDGGVEVGYAGADAAGPRLVAGLEAGQVPRVVNRLNGFGVVDETHHVEVVPGGDRRGRNVGDDLVLAVAALPHREVLPVNRLTN